MGNTPMAHADDLPTILGFFKNDQTSRSVNIFFSIQILDVCLCFFYFEEMTFLDIFDMYLMIFVINSQYLADLVNIWSKLININQI